MIASPLTRPQAGMPLTTQLAAALAAALTISALGALGEIFHAPLLIAAFGASCVLVFTLPASPLSSPVNVVGGHVVSAVCGLLVALALPATWWSMAVGVGVALAAMAALRVTHPPAGGTPIVILLADEGWAYLLVPILLGSLVVAVAGSLYRRVRIGRTLHKTARHPVPHPGG